MLSLIKKGDIHQCEDTDHVYAVVRKRPRATHMVRTGDLVPAGTMLVTPGLDQPNETNIFDLQSMNYVVLVCNVGHANALHTKLSQMR